MNMSIHDTIHCWLPDAENTQFSGESLAQSLYDFPLEILLKGELGAGKTTFLRGLAQGLGIDGPIVSPTFALEQRYGTASNIEFIHIDCYRLTSLQAETLLHGSDNHTGIRCIEWADRLEHLPDGPRIVIALQEEGDGRALQISFDDCKLPADEEIALWRTEVRLPPHITDHCETVARVCDALTKDLLSRGILVRPLLLRQAARLHDLLRFIDFLAHASSTRVTVTQEDQAVWDALKMRYKGQHHEEACATFLQERGYDALASVIAVHGVNTPTLQRRTIEQQLLYYADKRAALDHIVSLEGRVQDFIERHGPSAAEHGRIMLEEALRIERTFFPDGPPI
jgi:tRNA threonylcarbamoyladenosine biosynthesis protein TsaE